MAKKMAILTINGWMVGAKNHFIVMSWSSWCCTMSKLQLTFIKLLKKKKTFLPVCL